MTTTAERRWYTRVLPEHFPNTRLYIRRATDQLRARGIVGVVREPSWYFLCLHPHDVFAVDGFGFMLWNDHATSKGGVPPGLVFIGRDRDILNNPFITWEDALAGARYHWRTQHEPAAPPIAAK